MTTIALTLLLAFLPTSSDRMWQDGILTEVTTQQIDSRQTPPAVLPGDRMTLNYVVYEFSVQTGDRFYVADLGQGVLSRGVPKAANPIDLDVAAHIKFAVDKQTLYLKDKRGKEYKLGIVKQGFRLPENNTKP